jgi:chromosome segregation ATPase
MRRATASLPAILLLAGCATQPCDPNADRSIFQVGGCVMGGGYQQRVDTMQANLAGAQAQQADAQRAAAAAAAQRDRSLAEESQLRAELARERARTAQMQRDVAALRDSGRGDRERLAALQAELGALRAEQDRLGSAAPGPDARRRQQALVERRQQVERDLEAAGRAVRPE